MRKNVQNESKVKQAEMPLGDTGGHNLSLSIWNSHSRQTRRIFIFFL